MDESRNLGATAEPRSRIPGDPSPAISSWTLQQGIELARDWLLAEQRPDGHWVGELEGDTILESEFILLLSYLGRQDSTLANKAARTIERQQLPEGGWAIYPGGPPEISASVKAYFALKLTGRDPVSETMRRARDVIRAHGGADAVNSFTRFYLALLGQISYERCPAVPPEFLLAPKWFPVNIHSISAWSRTILVPLAIMWAFRPCQPAPANAGIQELFLKPPAEWPELRCPGLPGGTGLFSWDRFFRWVDRGLKIAQRWRMTPLRKRALRLAQSWMVDRFSGSDGLGAIFPPMIWSIVALRCLGYPDDSPEALYCHECLSGLFIEDEDSLRLQPCKSPVWDTAISLRALLESGLSASHPAATRGAKWLLDRQIDREGDWSAKVSAPPGGWCFEYANDFYPDLDDTSMVVMALHRQFASESESGDWPNGQARRRGLERPRSEPQDEHKDLLARSTCAIERAERWMLAMQNRDGGWGAFDKDNDREFLCYVPFADHNAMIDPSTPDLAARVLESLGQLGRRRGDPAVDRCLAYLRGSREADGSWFGRWGVNYIYGVWQVLTGLREVGVPAEDPLVTDGAEWLVRHQQPSGAWGESPDSYADVTKKGRGPATASQTAWAVLGLLAAGQSDRPTVARGVQWLLDTQTPAGDWRETAFTGTGFPRVFYLRYHLYRVYFPLLALSRYASARGPA